MKKSIILSLVLAATFVTPMFAAETTKDADTVTTVSEEEDAKSSASEKVEDEEAVEETEKETEEKETEAVEEVAEVEAVAIKAEVEETTEVEEVDAVTSASKKEVSDPVALRNLLSADGTWIAAITSDVTVTGGNLIVEGTFYSKDDKKGGRIYRKLALYAQDADKNVTANYTLKTDMMEIKTPNFRIQNGVIDGNLYIDAPGVEIINTEITGTIIYSNASYYDPTLISTAKYTKDIIVN